MAELFRVDEERPFESPWGRTFKNGSTTTAASESTFLQFHAKVRKVCLDSMLKRSGYNRIYMTPKAWAGGYEPGFSIIWMPGDRESIAQSASQLAQQPGLVRSRARLGMRVTEAGFQQAYQTLRPGQQVPNQVQVKVTVKASGLPAGVRAEDIAEWACHIGWRL